jgi:AcrR family transcriptional regulator
MVSISNAEAGSVEQRILDAAATSVLANGVDRVTLTEIARRARVSRPTIYRRWPDLEALLATLLTERIAGVLNQVPNSGDEREAVVERVVRVSAALRADEVVTSVIRNAPAFAMVYIAQRLGASQQILIDALAAAIKLAQGDGSIRPGDPQQMATMCLLITQSTIQSAQMVASVLDSDALEHELALSLNGYLRP